ncbi:winged helix-turn-helix domain-containing protein (plasmid) [Pseudoalteromonas piscicida]|uniref:winged helix-turn-helix domain-containing protein n=1 Tax=Pseudoalteromonas TaxID=53246 RepID=UPI001D09C214|nr:MULTISPECIES: winged helix-turn-helix domain-containing protein [Pseudoalteromonas]MCG7555867.1 winged helix-turn-helix domain-containing protein [Pseudoalteromonas sp. Of11M-6]UDM63632.1 winged helix-turn-helix domain-containing protein [Pseudoalteromonas piscicida]
MVENLEKRFLINEILVDLSNLSVCVDGSWRSIEAKHAALLRLLIANKGQVVTRDAILDIVWPGTIVSDNSVSQLVVQLRKLLGDSSNEPKIIKTVPRLGYQCIAQIEKAPTLLEQVEELSRGRGAQFALLGFFMGLVVTLLGVFITKQWQSDLQQQPVTATRITSSPGAEVFVRFSPNGNYLAYSYLAEGADQFDLAVYDLETKTTHTIKSSGYSEESASWSLDGNWLIYSRSDPVSCEVRALHVKGPIEMWRLARDSVLGSCNSAQDSAPWLEYRAGHFITKSWDKAGTYLQSVAVTFADNQPKVLNTTALPIRDVTHYQVNQQTLLYQVKEQGVYRLNLGQLGDLESQTTTLSKQSFSALSHGYEDDTVIIAKQNLSVLKGREQQLLYSGFGAISEIDVNANLRASAHTEGVAEINFYQLAVDAQSEAQQKQLTSPARMDLLAALSDDGAHFVYASVTTKNNDAPQFELWHKHAFRPTSSLLGTMPLGEVPILLLLSPNNEYLAVLSKSHKVYLISSFTKEVKKVVDNFAEIADLHWSQDGRNLYYRAKLSAEAKWQAWQFTVSQGRSEQQPLVTHSPDLPLTQKNPSFVGYKEQVREYLITALTETFDVEQLRGSLSLYQPAVYRDGVYFVLKRGHQLVLYRYLSSENKVEEIQPIGLHLYAGFTELQVLSSFDGSQVVFNRINNYESDIVLLEYGDR